MTSLIKPVPQREIEEKKQGSGERTAQILKKKEKGMNMDQNTLLGVLIPFVGTTAGAACVFFLKNEYIMRNFRRVFGDEGRLNQMRFFRQMTEKER